MLHEELSQQIIGLAFKVYNKMGFGYDEVIYKRCLMIELRKAGIPAEREVEVDVFYDDELVGKFKTDIIVNGVLVLEMKSIRALAPAHEVQLVNYLVSTRHDVGLLINFGETKVEIKRKTRVLGMDKNQS